jgi:predicted nucleotidyltransferase
MTCVARLARPSAGSARRRCDGPAASRDVAGTGTGRSSGGRRGRVGSVIEVLLSGFVRWAAGRPDVQGVLLVGSHARGTARPDSDVDLVVLTDAPASYVDDAGWPARFGDVVRRDVEDWGRVTSVRVLYATGLEVEFGITPPDWVDTPFDPGTRRVVEGGCRVLFDRDGSLATLASPPSSSSPSSRGTRSPT